MVIKEEPKIYPFQLKFNYTFFWETHTSTFDDKILKWCYVTLISSWEFYYVQAGESYLADDNHASIKHTGLILQPIIIISIEKENDAMHFKLRWM